MMVIVPSDEACYDARSCIFLGRAFVVLFVVLLHHHHHSEALVWYLR